MFVEHVQNIIKGLQQKKYTVSTTPPKSPKQLYVDIGDITLEVESFNTYFVRCEVIVAFYAKNMLDGLQFFEQLIRDLVEVLNFYNISFDNVYKDVVTEVLGEGRIIGIVLEFEEIIEVSE